ncbi:hypothetical protein T440DRAFT_558009 [Plenodomus tracheiphilus IPT5]|uniref:Ankyrin n=1 Tax=Plenodomus tracheiphilus IPT5 TaxID=1408161 RepID=A0A6A7AUP2_9PLEO|nr:hypothetical protein T440DRAFT_558009 [Plenodomus tracheiphilus IPT5]
MRVPLEILRMILDHARNTYTEEQLLHLALAAGVFQEDIVPHIFPCIDYRKVFKPSLWSIKPRGPHELLLYYATTKYYEDQTNLFSFLFVPVCQRQFAKLGLHWTTSERSRQMVLEWCRLAMHKQWKLEWVAENIISDMEDRIAHYPVECEFMQGLYDGDRVLTARERLDKRHENDRKFLEIGLAIVNDDEDAVLSGFSGFYSGVDDLNYCFGTTLLALAVRSGTSAMLQLLLRSTSTLCRKNLYIYLGISMARHNDSVQFIGILLDRLCGTDNTAKHRFVTDVLEKAIWDEDAAMFYALIHWVDTSGCAPEKLPVLEWTFNYLLWPRTTQKKAYTFCCGDGRIRDFLTDRVPPPIYSDYAILSVIPEHYLGRPYLDQLESWYDILRNFKNWTPTTNMSWCYHEQRLVKGAAPRPPMSFSPLYVATVKGQLIWVDWLLWAGADPRHLEGDASLLDCAWIAGKRKEVAVLLKIHGWDAWDLELRPGESSTKRMSASELSAKIPSRQDSTKTSGTATTDDLLTDMEFRVHDTAARHRQQNDSYWDYVEDSRCLVLDTVSLLDPA